jgi:hypothetical protein
MPVPTAMQGIIVSKVMPYPVIAKLTPIMTKNNPHARDVRATFLFKVYTTN